MSGIKSIFLFLTLLFVCTAWTQGVRGETFNRVVAIVNDEVITLHELHKKLKEISGLDAEEMRQRDEKGFLQARRTVLDILINDRITDAKVKELGIQVNPGQVEAAIEKIKKDNQITHEDLLAKLKEKGMTYEQYRESIKKDIEREKLIHYQVKSKIIIREEQIIQYYEEHKDEFNADATVRLAMIFIKKDDPDDPDADLELKRKAESILARLKNGEDFAKLAKQYTDGPGADEGGEIGEFKLNQLEPKLRTAIGTLQEGETTGLLIRPNGIQIIKLIEKTGTKTKTLEEARNAIYAALFREEVNKRYMDWIKDLREKSYTKVIF